MGKVYTNGMIIGLGLGLIMLNAFLPQGILAALEPPVFNIRQYGAVGDGIHKDTAALQKAIDACNAAGGGRVEFPTGNYLSGTIMLRSNVTLYLDTDATLWGSQNFGDYNHAHPRLIYAEKAVNVGIEGSGTINGQGEAFWRKIPGFVYKGEDWAVSAHRWYEPLERPGNMIEFRNCQKVNVRDVTLTNSPAWTLHFLYCDQVNAMGIKIRNPLYGPNTDGIDINACVDVNVNGCDIITGDDAVCLKSKDPHYKRPSRNITVTNCRICTTCNGFKIGTETLDAFENIVFRDSEIYNFTDDYSERAISGISIETVDGSRIDGVKISNIKMSKVRNPFFIRLGHRGTDQAEPKVPGSLKNVVIENVTATGVMGESSITGLPGYRIENVTFSNIAIQCEGGGPAAWGDKKVKEAEVVAAYPESRMFGRLPTYGFYCRHINGLMFANIRLSCIRNDFRPAFIGDDVQNVTLNQYNPEASLGSQQIVRLIGVQNIQIANCTAPKGTKLFLNVEGAASDRIELHDNHLENAVSLIKVSPPELMKRVWIDGKNSL